MKHDRSRGVACANKQARSKIQECWVTMEGRISCVSGKDLLSKLSKWSQEKFRVSFGAVAILKELKRHEIDPEIVQVLTAIENATLFQEL